jgi:hypothetical protein
MFKLAITVYAPDYRDTKTYFGWEDTREEAEARRERLERKARVVGVEITEEAAS